MDVRSAAADPILAAVEAARNVAALREGRAPTRALGIDRLRLWDRQVDGRPVVTLYEAFVRALWRRTFADELDADGLQGVRSSTALPSATSGSTPIIDDPTSHWWNDIATVDRRESAGRHRAAGGRRCRDLSCGRKFGDEANWAWDRVHAVTFRHALGAGGFALNWFFSRGPVPQPGDSWTVRKASVNDREPYGVVDIWRRTGRCSTSATGISTLAVNTTGQSGNR